MQIKRLVERNFPIGKINGAKVVIDEKLSRSGNSGGADAMPLTSADWELSSR